MDLEELEKENEMERENGTGNDGQSSRHRSIHITKVMSTNLPLILQETQLVMGALKLEMTCMHAV